MINIFKNSLIFISIFVFTVYATEKNYLALYKNFKKNHSEHDHHIDNHSFLESFNSKEKIDAIIEISNSTNSAQVTVELFSSLESSLRNNEDLKNNLYSNLKNINNSDIFRIVAIDFLDDSFKSGFESQEFDRIVYEIAMNENNTVFLRNAVLSHFSKNFFQQYENREKIKTLLHRDNASIIRGISLATKSALNTIKSQEEIETWVDPIIKNIDYNKNNLKEIKALIIALGLTKSNRAKNYLHSLFLEQIRVNSPVINSIVISLGKLADEKIFRDVLLSFDKYKDDYGDKYEIELLEKNFCKENNIILKVLKDKNDDNGKICFLLAQQKLKYDYSENDIQRTKELLSDNNTLVRLEAVKALRFMLPHDEECKLYSAMKKRETSKIILDTIFLFCGDLK